ncbi:S1 RNA-binding domain-containing protein [Patescibacteria group bacterium]|nr:S1 RNA-binding domain-containing protein [Patescibacteria group bacterium]MBU1890456.1 S1 RNA-binding domain-containing protein [Patescibacteria group bacterium]
MQDSTNENKDKNTSAQPSEMEKLLDEQGAIKIPRVGDIIDGTIISVSKNEVHVDIEGLCSGVVRGRELYDESGEYTDLNVGDKVQATVFELENEKGVMELSFRQAGHKKAWDLLFSLKEEKTIVDAAITEANRGGLMVKVGRVVGFLPVSQLTVEHYPRVEGGDKDKILEKLLSYVDKSFKVRVIDLDEEEEKLIVSEKLAWEDKQKVAIDKYKVGGIVEGKVTGVVDFGAFVEFGDGLEGLVHISELAWQRIDDPREIIKVGDAIKAKIISIDNSRISLSMKQLKEDPWRKAISKYEVGQVVKGEVLKLNPFGVFVELDDDIHGLAHISELSYKLVRHPGEIVKIGDKREFKILSIEPDNHRLGLSIKALEKPAQGGSQPASGQDVSDGKDEQQADNTEAKPTKTEPKEEKEDKGDERVKENTDAPEKENPADDKEKKQT